jgi:hypothetical protein
MSNYTNMKCLCGWYDIYDVEETSLYVYDPESGTYADKNDEIPGLADDLNQKDDMFVYMDECYTDVSDTVDTESTQVMFDMEDNYALLSDDDEEDEELVELFNRLYISE